MTRILNLTPHVIRLPGLTLQPTGIIPRCVEESISLGSFAGVELVARKYGQVTDLPEPRQGVLLIVSMLVRLAHPEREDLASPGDLVRDGEGRILGAKNLVVNR